MNLPEAFIARMKASLGEEGFASFHAALETPAPVSVRLNRKKIDLTLQLKKVPWSEDAYFLNERPLFASDPLWHAGAYYVQEASSMLIEHAFISARNRLDGPLKILDLCAAPGGKSTHIASLINEDDVMVSNEVIRSRVSVLSENLKKQGYSNVIISQADSSDFEKLGEIFDLILVDAPCSGEGLFRKDPDAIQYWTPENLLTCELRQNRILSQIKNCLKTGGFLIYSTCTYNPGENEKQLEFLQKNGFELSTFKVSDKEYTSYQCLPHQFEGEGFFLALMQKTRGNQIEESRTINKSNLQPVKVGSEWKNLLHKESSWRIFQDKVLASSEETFNFLDEELSGLQVSSVGIEVGKLNKNLFLPSETLPFSIAFNQDFFPSIDLSHQEALYYLSKNSIPNTLKSNGYVYLTYNSCPIGFGKLAGNRINNLFPSAWRLRHTPAKENWFSIDSFF